MPFHTLMEPFRIKTVEPIQPATPDQRIEALERAHYNLFGLRSEDVLLDFLSDSGTGAMSTRQWAGMMQGDEAYAGSASFMKFEQAVREITGFQYVIPTHQGRAAEHLLFGCILQPTDMVPNNTHFDTTRANVEHRGAEAVDLLIPEGKQPDLIHPFKGNMDLDKLGTLLRDQGDRIPLVMLTVTNNSGGGQPVSMANIRAASDLCRRYAKPLIIDACRFAENAWFIKQREEDYAHIAPLAIAREMFGYANGCIMSAKNDGLANMGGFLALNNETWAQQCRTMLMLAAGFPTYGGMAGYDMEAVAVGLYEALTEDYLRYRIGATAQVGEKITQAGIPIVRPAGWVRDLSGRESVFAPSAAQ